MKSRLRSVIYDLSAAQADSTVQFYIDGVAAEMAVLVASKGDIIDGVRAETMITATNEVPIVQRWPVVCVNGIPQVYDQRIIINVQVGSGISGYLRVFYLS